MLRRSGPIFEPFGVAEGVIGVVSGSNLLSNVMRPERDSAASRGNAHSRCRVFVLIRKGSQCRRLRKSQLGSQSVLVRRSFTKPEKEIRV